MTSREHASAGWVASWTAALMIVGEMPAADAAQASPQRDAPVVAAPQEATGSVEEETPAVEEETSAGVEEATGSVEEETSAGVEEATGSVKEEETPPRSAAGMQSSAPIQETREDPWAASRRPRPRSRPVGGAPPEAPSPIPGGYWGLGEAPSIAPPDGHDEIVAGSVLVPVGLLAAGTALPMLYFFAPDHCEERAPRLGYRVRRGQCRGMFIGNAVRVAYGVGMALSGAVLLAVGLHRRRKHRHWERHHVRFDLGPTPDGLHGGVSFRF